MRLQSSSWLTCKDIFNGATQACPQRHRAYMSTVAQLAPGRCHRCCKLPEDRVTACLPVA